MVLNMRSIWVVAHRWFGLATAVFLFIAGLTGAIISWDHEVDEWLNPQLYKAKTQSLDNDLVSPLALANKFEAENPQLMVSFMPLNIEADHSLLMTVMPRPLPETGKAAPVDFNQVAIDPATSEVQATRMWGQISLTRENILPFLYKLHYSMHIPDGFGLELGILFMGIIAIVWTIDSFIALWISFPKAKSWKKSFRFRWKQGGYKLNFDLHRSGGVWLWAFVLILAVTSISMNLNNEVMRPVISVFSELTPTPFDQRTPTALDEPVNAELTREQILPLAHEQADKMGITDPAGGIFYASHYDVYGVGFYTPENDHGDGGLGNPWLYFDGKSGEYLGGKLPGQGTAGDIFIQAQFPLHSGRIIGLPGRVMVSIMGLMIAIFSVTGIIIWAKKRRARVSSRINQALSVSSSLH